MIHTFPNCTCELPVNQCLRLTRYPQYEAKSNALYMNGAYLHSYQTDKLAQDAANRWQKRSDKFHQNII